MLVCVQCGHLKIMKNLSRKVAIKYLNSVLYVSDNYNAGGSLILILYHAFQRVNIPSSYHNTHG